MTRRWEFRRGFELLQYGQWSTHPFPNIWWKRAVLLNHVESTKRVARFINDILIMLAVDSWVLHLTCHQVAIVLIMLAICMCLRRLTQLRWWRWRCWWHVSFSSHVSQIVLLMGWWWWRYWWHVSFKSHMSLKPAFVSLLDASKSFCACTWHTFSRS